MKRLLVLLLVACGESPSDRDTRDALGALDMVESDTESDTSESDTADDTSGDTVDTNGPDTNVADTNDTHVVDAVWDLAMIRDATTASCTFGPARQTVVGGIPVSVMSTSYTSWESIDGVLAPITIRGFLARPSATGRRPGIVLAHGLGGFAEESQATGLAALTSSVILAYTGPGGGSSADNTSEGRPAGFADGLRMFDTVPDVRGSWFWGHAVAAMRALTCLAARDDVDPTRLGMTGYSAGAVATLTVAGVDDRLVAAVPLSGTLAWDIATTSPEAWQHSLLAQPGLNIASERWLRLMELLAPATLLSGTSTPVLMINGTTDEFFPVAAHVATYEHLPASRRTSFVGNFDHGCYALTGGESAAAIEARGAVRATGGQYMWFAHHFGTDARFATLPGSPTLDLQQVGPALVVEAALDEPAGLNAVDVRLWWSIDDGLLWGHTQLERQAPGRYGVTLAVTAPPNTLAFVDVEYEAGALGPRFSLSSTPEIPDGHIPKIRAAGTCLAP